MTQLVKIQHGRYPTVSRGHLLKVQLLVESLFATPRIRSKLIGYCGSGNMPRFARRVTVSVPSK